MSAVYDEIHEAVRLEPESVWDGVRDFLCSRRDPNGERVDIVEDLMFWHADAFIDRLEALASECPAAREHVERAHVSGRALSPGLERFYALQHRLGLRSCGRWRNAKATDSVSGTEGVVDHYARDIRLPPGEDSEPVFRELEERLLRYDIFPSWLMRPEVCSDDGSIEEGTTIVQHVAIGPFWLEAAVRVERVWRVGEEGATETGFTYATLEGHPERGVSTFRLTRSADGRLTFRIEARSRPGSMLTRLTRPLARRFQRRATRAALAHFADIVMTRLVDSPHDIGQR